MLQRVWSAFMGALIPWGLVGIFVTTIAWTGIVHACQAAPPRYAAELEDFEPQEALRPFGDGTLMGWYVYVYVGEERVVCANPSVWDGPKVITCSHFVAIDNDVPQAQAETAGPLAGFVPDVDHTTDEQLRREIDLILKRLTWEGRNAER